MLIPLGFIAPVTRLPAIFVLGFWFVLQLINSMFTAAMQGGGVAWGAHIGCFVAGMILIPFFKNSRTRLFAPARR